MSIKLKTAKEWAMRFKLHSVIKSKKFETQVNDIQLDAYMAGLLKAMEIARQMNDGRDWSMTRELERAIRMASVEGIK